MAIALESDLRSTPERRNEIRAAVRSLLVGALAHVDAATVHSMALVAASCIELHGQATGREGDCNWLADRCVRLISGELYAAALATNADPERADREDQARRIQDGERMDQMRYVAPGSWFGVGR